MKIMLCILVLNEYECLKVILPKLFDSSNVKSFHKILAIDGGSVDGSVELLSKYGIEVFKQKTKGRGGAIIDVINYYNVDSYVFFSPDGNEDINDLYNFKLFLEKGFDLVIASRMMKGGINEEDRNFFKFRKWANNFFNFIANLIFNKSGFFATDSINGYRGATRSLLIELNLDAVDYTIEYQMTIRAFKNNAKIIEFPTIEFDRIAGQTGAESIKTGILFLRRLVIEFYLLLK